MTAIERQNIILPPHVSRVVAGLQQDGWEAWLVGGCVRDSLLGRPCHDYDVATNAPPERVLGLFPVVRPTGLAFGGVTVVEPQGQVEVTTYRADLGYSDGRHPDGVALGAGMEEDAARRDFTVGALYWSPEAGLCDPTGQGLADLRGGVIRAVGDPERRFEEDALRILRAVRFSAELGFVIEANTKKALGVMAPGLARISRERVTAELVKLLVSPRPQRMALLEELGILEMLLGGGAPAADTAPPDFYLPARVPARPEARMAAFCLGRGLSPAALEESLRLPKVFTARVRDALAACHAGPREDSLWLKTHLAKVGEGALRDGLDLWQGAAGEDMSPARRELGRILTAGEPWKPEHLAVDGRDLLALGMKGEEVGACLRALTALCMADPARNQKELLLGRAREMGAGR